MLSKLNGEGYEISYRDLTALRQSLRLRMRQANIGRNSGTLQRIAPQPTHEDLVRLQRRCQESDQRLMLGTRRTRSVPYHGIPADEDLQPRFPSEKTISACKIELGLSDDRNLYMHVRNTFQRICTEAGISKKSCDMDEWERVKLDLLDAVPYLDQTYSPGSLPPKGSDLWFSLDIICSDVAKKIRVLGSRLNIKEVKTLLQLDPSQTAKFRDDFKKLLHGIRFVSRLDVPADVWNRLERTIYAESPYLHAVLPEELLGSNDRRAKAFSYMCRDISKRYNDRRRGRNSIKHDKVFATPPATSYNGPPLSTPASQSNLTPRAPRAILPRPSNLESPFAKPSLCYTADGLAAISFDSDSSGAKPYHTPENSWPSDDGYHATGISPITSDSSTSFGGNANGTVALATADYGTVASATADYGTGSFGPYYLSANAWATKNQDTITYGNEGFTTRVGPLGNQRDNMLTQSDRYQTPAVIPTMGHDAYNTLFLEAQDDFFGRWDHLPVIQTVENYGGDEHIHEDHQDIQPQFGLEATSVIPSIEHDSPNMLPMEYYDGITDRSGPQTMFSTAENNLLDMQGMDNLQDFLTRFAPQPVAAPGENDVFNMQIGQRIEVGDEFGRSQDHHGAPCEDLDVSNWGAEDFLMSHNESVGESTRKDGNHSMEFDYPDQSMEDEYPDPTGFEI